MALLARNQKLFTLLVHHRVRKSRTEKNRVQIAGHRTGSRDPVSVVHHWEHWPVLVRPIWTSLSSADEEDETQSKSDRSSYTPARLYRTSSIPLTSLPSPIP